MDFYHLIAEGLLTAVGIGLGMVVKWFWARLKKMEDRVEDITEANAILREQNAAYRARLLLDGPGVSHGKKKKAKILAEIEAYEREHGPI